MQTSGLVGSSNDLDSTGRLWSTVPIVALSGEERLDQLVAKLPQPRRTDRIQRVWLDVIGNHTRP
jgi:hypothetical protein